MCRVLLANVHQAMTPIQDVFMLSIDAVLDWETLRQICLTGHSRVPVYEEVDVPFGYGGDDQQNMRVERVKKIVGILLVKQVCSALLTNVCMKLSGVCR